MLASASNAIVIGFNVRPEPSAKNVAEEQKVDVRLYRVIYNAIEDITAAMKASLTQYTKKRLSVMLKSEVHLRHLVSVQSVVVTLLMVR